MFDTIIGNKTTKETLEKSIKANKISHSYLFIGIEGIGKALIAKEFSKEILKHETSNNPDFIYIEPEGGSIKIGQIRNTQKKVAEKPIVSDNKVCIIDNADLMTTEAQNCLLKTLEEPPSYMTIILIGRNESDFLQTIKSRCTIVHFEPLKDEEIKQYLNQNFDELDNLSNIIAASNGSIGKAINLKDKTEIYANIDQIIEDIEKCDIIELLKNADSIYNSKDEIYEILEYVNVLLIKKSKTSYKYANCIQIVEETKKRIKANSNYNMCIDYMLFGIWGEVNEKYSRSQI